MDITCPKCGTQPQTLGHVLNACTLNSGLMRERHNLILQRLSKALLDTVGDKYLEQKIKDSPGDPRTDLVVWHLNGSVSIVDVTISFEGRVDAFQIAWSEKSLNINH